MFQWRVYEGGLFTTDQIFQKKSQRRIFQNFLIPNRKSWNFEASIVLIKTKSGAFQVRKFNLGLRIAR